LIGLCMRENYIDRENTGMAEHVVCILAGDI
jgi:hypothetical protein